MVQRSPGVLVGVLGDRVVACDIVRHQAHFVGGLLAWLVLLDEATPLAELVADVVASTAFTEEEARRELTEALRLGESLHLLSRKHTSPSPKPARSEQAVVLRGGAVRSPAGDVWLLPGGDDRGIPTLIGALVQTGCDELGREFVSVKGNSIVVASPRSMRGEYGPIARVLLCEHKPNGGASAVPLNFYDAAQVLIGSALDLSRTGDPGLQMLCDLAATAPGNHILHHDPVALARVLVATEEWNSLADLDRQLRRQSRQLPDPTQAGVNILDDLGAHSSNDVVFHHATIEGESVTFVIDGSGSRSWALTGLHRRIWHAVTADDLPNLSDLVRDEADSRGGSDERSARLVARALASLVEQGLVHAGDDGPGTDFAGDGGQSEEAKEMWRYGPPGPPTPREAAAEPWPRLASDGFAVDWIGNRLVTDVDPIRRVLAGLRRVEPGEADAPRAPEVAVVEIRSVPQRLDQMVIRLNGSRLWYVRDDDGLAVLGIILANLAADRDRFGQPLGEISTATWSDRCVVAVGGASPSDPSEHDEKEVRHLSGMYGARVDDGKVLLPEPARAAKWLTDGASLDEVAGLWTPHVLAGVIVRGARDVLSGWLRALTELSPGEGTSERYLSETVARGDVALSVVNDGETLSGAAERILGATGASERTRDRESAAAETDLSSAAWRWASRLGRASWAEESAKIARRRLSTGRELLKIQLPEHTRDRVRNAIAGLGVNMETAEEIARASAAAGNLYLGVESAGSHIRRKLYVRGVPAHAWHQIASGWPHRLRHGADTPYWLAWKWTDDRPGVIERAVYLAHLGGAETSGEAIDPLMDVMNPEWVDVVDHLLVQIGVGRQAVPDDGDLLALDEGGRRSVDISRRPGARISTGFVAESRWLAAAADLTDTDSADLEAWAHGRVLSRLIFGIDGRGERFVNLYGSRFTDR